MTRFRLLLPLTCYLPLGVGGALDWFMHGTVHDALVGVRFTHVSIYASVFGLACWRLIQRHRDFKMARRGRVPPSLVNHGKPNQMFVFDYIGLIGFAMILFSNMCESALRVLLGLYSTDAASLRFYWAEILFIIIAGTGLTGYSLVIRSVAYIDYGERSWLHPMLLAIILGGLVGFLSSVT